MQKSIVPKVVLGDVFISETVLDSVPIDQIAKWIDNHEYGDWGKLKHSDKLINESNLTSHNPILSLWQHGTCRVFIVTNGTHSNTWIVSPKELKEMNNGTKRFRSGDANKAFRTN